MSADHSSSVNSFSNTELSAEKLFSFNIILHFDKTGLSFFRIKFAKAIAHQFQNKSVQVN